LVERIEQQDELNVVVYTSENPEFFIARCYVSDTSPIAFAPTESEGKFAGAPHEPAPGLRRR
jgi:hypothetical protein